MDNVMDINNESGRSTNPVEATTGDDPQTREEFRGGEINPSSLTFNESHINRIQFACPKCNADLTAFFKRKLSLTTGISEEVLENGGLKALPTIVSAGKLILEVSGIKFDTGEIAKISNQMALDTLERLQKIDLEEKARNDYEHKLSEMKNKIDEREEKIRDAEKKYEKLEAEHEELKTKVLSNPALKGALAESELLEDIEANFPEQKFKDITNQGNGDYLWQNIHINIGKWIDSGIGAVIDSKSKSKINEYDIDKLKRDMKFCRKEIGIIIAAKQSQLRMKEIPCGIYRSEEGYILVASRENLNHHIALRFVRDVLARLLYEMRASKEDSDIDVGKLSSMLNDIEKAKEYHKKVKSKAQGIINDIDSEEDYLKMKFQEAWKLLGLGSCPDAYEQVKLCR